MSSSTKRLDTEAEQALTPPPLPAAAPPPLPTATPPPLPAAAPPPLPAAAPPLLLKPAPPVSPTFGSPPPFPASPATRPQWLRAAAVVVPVVLILGALVFWLVNRPTTQAPRPSSATADVTSPAPSAPAVPPGRLVVDAVPWAEVVRIADADGNAISLPDDPYTPFVLTLAPGHYSVDLSHPDLGDEKRRCEVEVLAGAASECQPELVKIDAEEYFKEAGW